MNTIVLTNSDSLVCQLSGGVTSNQPEYVFSYADNDGSTFSEGRSEGSLNGATQVTVVSSPAASTRRIIKSFSVYNKDTADVVVTLFYDNGTSQRTIAKVTLNPGDLFTDEKVFTASGQVKTAAGETDNTVTLIGEQTLTNKTLTALSNTIYADEVRFAGDNESGSTILKGTPVYVSGYNTGNDEAEIGLADAGLTSQSPAIGIAGEDIANASVGPVVVSGVIEGLDTSAYSVGDLLYLNVTGGLTNTKPNYTFTASYVQAMAVVLRSNAGAGVIQVLPYLPYLRLPTAAPDLAPKGYVDDTIDDTINETPTSKSAAWTLDITEARYYKYTGASAVNATVPPNSTEAFSIGTVVYIEQAGAGVVTAVAGAGVTINSEDGEKTAGQYDVIALKKTATDTWTCIGGVA